MGIGDLISDFFGSKNQERAPTVNPYEGNYQYAGDPLGAEVTAERYRKQGEAAQNRQGPQVNYAQANVDRAFGRQARTQQGAMADLMTRRAQGLTPSIAQMQADRQMQQATAAQASAAASARGPAAMALAQQNAANNTATMQSSISNQAQINAVQERQAAEQAAFGARAAMRQGDLASQQQAAQQQQYQSGLEMAQRGINDQFSLGMAGLEHGVRQSQLGAGMNYEAQRAGNTLGAAGINAGVGGQNAGMNQQNGWGLVGMVRDAAGAGASILGKADGGPVGGQQPYLVGERGPELIVPARDGMVIPAEQTREILGRANGGAVSGVGGGVDLGNNIGISGDMIGAASTGLAGNVGIRGMVGGGGITGGGGAPGGAGIVPLADGGPVQGALEPAASTWGTGGPDVAAQHRAILESAIAAQQAQRANQQVQAYESPYARDVRQVQALRQLNPELVSEEDDARERRGIAMLGLQRKGDAAKAKSADAPKKGAPKEEAKPAVKREDTIDRMVKSAPAEYRPMGGYVPPSLVGLPEIRARANGGPVQGAGVLPLYEPPGQLLQVGDDGRAYLASAASDDGRPSLAGLASMSSEKAPPVVARIPVASQAKARKMTEEEMMREAEKLYAQMSSEHQERMAAGPAVRGMAAMKK